MTKGFVLGAVALALLAGCASKPQLEAGSVNDRSVLDTKHGVMLFNEAHFKPMKTSVARKLLAQKVYVECSVVGAVNATATAQGDKTEGDVRLLGWGALAQRAAESGADAAMGFSEAHSEVNGGKQIVMTGNLFKCGGEISAKRVLVAERFLWGAKGKQYRHYVFEYRGR